MKHVGIALVSAVLALPLVAQAAPAEIVGPASSTMATCGSITSQSAFPGGFRINRKCDGLTVSGIGTTLNDAFANASDFGSLLPGTRCTAFSSSDVDGFPGGYRLSFDCGTRFVAGYGTTATDAGNNAFGFAEIYASTGVSCRSRSTDYDAFPGGFRVALQCNTGSQVPESISGVGMTVSDAGDVALGFAEIVATTGNSCYVGSYGVKLDGLVYKVSYTCDTSTVVGYGSTSTAAALDALANAQGL